MHVLKAVINFLIKNYKRKEFLFDVFVYCIMLQIIFYIKILLKPSPLYKYIFKLNRKMIKISLFLFFNMFINVLYPGQNIWSTIYRGNIAGYTNVNIWP